MMTENKNITIEENELTFSFSCSSGPGGQNVNKVATRVTLYFNVAASPKLTEHQRRLTLEKLATRIDKKGVLRVISYRYRTQGQNRKAAVDRLHELLNKAVQEAKPRRKTKIPRSATRKRLKAKKSRSALKKKRSVNVSRDE